MFGIPVKKQRTVSKIHGVRTAHVLKSEPFNFFLVVQTGSQLSYFKCNDAIAVRPSKILAESQQTMIPEA